MGRGRLTLHRALDRWAIRAWARAADAAGAMDMGQLAALRGRAGRLRQRLDRFIHVADGRLAHPRIGAEATLPRPLNSDWSHRPEIFAGPIPRAGRAGVETRTRIGTAAQIFHDCTQSEVTVRQVRNRREADLAPYGLRLDVFRFDGGFLSVAIDLPASAVEGLTRASIVQVNLIAEVEAPLGIQARLNIRHGPNTEQILCDLPQDAPEATAEFDMAYTGLNDRRMERAWIDLIFDAPGMNQITLRDMTLNRRPRAEM